MPVDFAVFILAPVAGSEADAARQDGCRIGRRGCIDGSVDCMAVHEGRWLPGGHAQGTQPLLRCQLTRMSRHWLLWKAPDSLLPLLRCKLQIQSRQKRCCACGDVSN